MNAPATGPTDQSNAPAWVRHPGLRQWVSEVAQLTKPDRVVWCDGSQAEYDRLCDSLVANGTFIRLSEKLRPDSFLARSHPSDVARMEERTFICSRSKEDAGPNHVGRFAAIRGKISYQMCVQRRDRRLYVKAADELLSRLPLLQ